MQTMPTMQTVRKLQMANGAQLHLKGITTNICPNHNNNNNEEQRQRQRGYNSLHLFWQSDAINVGPISIFYALMTSHKNGHIVMHMNEPDACASVRVWQCVCECVYVLVCATIDTKPQQSVRCQKKGRYRTLAESVRLVHTLWAKKSSKVVYWSTAWAEI